MKAYQEALLPFLKELGFKQQINSRENNVAYVLFLNDSTPQIGVLFTKERAYLNNYESVNTKQGLKYSYQYYTPELFAAAIKESVLSDLRMWRPRKISGYVDL